MKNKVENAFYFFTLWFSVSIIALGLIGLIFKVIIHFIK
jgi:hypothetical protein